MTGSNAATPSHRAALASDGSPNHLTLLAVPALLGRRPVGVAVLIRVGVGIRIRISVGVTVTIRVAVTVRVTVAVTVAVAVAIRVAVRVAVVVVTVVVTVARVSLAPVDAVLLDVPCNERASLFGIDLTDACVVHDLGKQPALVRARGWLYAVLRDAHSQGFSGGHIALIRVATVRDACVAHLRGGSLAPVFASRRLWIGTRLFHASRENLAGFSVTAIYGATLIETLHLMLSGLRFTNLLTGRRRAFLHALEEAVDRAAEARLAVTAVVRARIEDGKRRPNAIVTALAGRHAFPIGSLVENSRKLGPVASGVAAAAL